VVSNDARGRREAPAHVVLGPNGLVGLPLKTLSDEYRDTPEPEDSDRVPAPVPPSLGRRIVDRLDIALRARNAGEK
jgi:hypothetical protein